MANRFRDRPTGELMVMIIALTICGYIALTATVILILALFTDRDLSDPARNIADIINTLIGLLAGYLAGRTDTVFRNDRSDRVDPPGDGPEEPS